MALMDEVKIRRLTEADLVPNMLDGFNRYQEVVNVWRTVGDQKVIVKEPFIEQWNVQLKREIVTHDLSYCFNQDGLVFLATHKDRVIAFASLLHNSFGSQNQYLQLMQLHVSSEYRRLGLGRALFILCAAQAKVWGGEKTLYFRTLCCRNAEFL